jgi:2-polyprenyl-3-methyl-5-hydroxy-6-metoxy-1,4-benzoquinol methylase
MSSSLDKVEYLRRIACPFHSFSKNGTSETLHEFESINDKTTGQTFRILRCSLCGAGLTDPYPSEATVKWLYLGRESVSNFDPIRGTIMDWMKGVFAQKDLRRAHALGSSPEIASVLDFGAGVGRFSLASKEAFPNCCVDAVDFDHDPPSYLQGIAGIRYLQYHNFLAETRQYDFILLRGVLEHVHDPVNLLQELGRRLSPRGILYMEVPNIDSAYIHYFGRDCNGYGVPYHLFNFDFSSFETIIKAAGLTGRIFFKGLPLAGCVLATKLRQERTLVHQIAGIILHPAQLYLESKKGKYILAAVCSKQESDTFSKAR